MRQNLLSKVEHERLRLKNYQTRLGYLNPESRLREKRSYAVELEERLRDRMEKVLLLKKHRLELLAGQVESLSPVKKLSQGYAYVTGPDGKALRSADKVRVNEELDIQLYHGSLKAQVTEVRSEVRGDILTD